jgi:hypothetical protein
MSMKSLIRSASVRASVALAFGLSFAAPSFAQLASGVDVSKRMEKAHAAMQEIQSRAERVNDINTLRNLQHQYGYYVDEALWDEVADMFTNDGTMELGLNGVYVGKESIRKYLYSLTRGKPGLQHGELNTHFQLSPVITLAPDGKSAKGRWRGWIQAASEFGGKSGGDWGEGIYENEYVKEDGVWKIKKLHFFVKFYAPYEGGWTKAPKESALRYGKSRIRPDRPTTVKYQPYPAKFTVPFHYENPVTSGYKPHTPDVKLAELKKAETLAELEAQVRALELQVERMQAVDEIENLESAYGYYVDKSMQDAIAGMFAEESTLEILGRGVFIGRDRIYEYMRRLGAPRYGGLYNHMQLQPVFTISRDGTSAQVRSRLLVMFAQGENRAQWGEAIYENTFVRENGVWKYKNLHAYQTFYANYEEGWAKHTAGMFSPFANYPPDMPQSVPYKEYPAVFVAPFHYKHPVTGK